MPLDELNNPEPTTTDWPPLDRSLLGDARPAPVGFPLHVLSGRWRAWVEAASLPFGSADYLAQGLLAAVAAVCGAGVRAEVAPHWREPLILWQVLIGGPSSGKSAAFARVTSLLAEVKPWPESTDIAAPRVLVDADLDQCDTALYGSGRGVLLWRNDLADWMEAAARRAERPAWLAAWDAAPAMIHRSPEDMFAVDIAGALSPDRLSPGFVEGDSALAARFLYCWPAGAEPPSLADVAPDDEGLVALLQKIATFAGHRETPAVVPLDEPATRWLEALMVELRERAEAADGLEAEWIAKGVPTLVRLAALLSLMQWADESDAEWAPVTIAHLDSAYALWSDYYLPHAQSVFDRGGVAGCERAARRVTRWLKRLRAPEISREDVRRQALCQTVNAEGAEDVLARLEAGGVVRPLQATGSEKGGPRRRRWAVHPHLAGWRS